MVYPNLLTEKLLHIFVFNIYKQIHIVCLHLFTNICNYIPYSIYAGAGALVVSVLVVIEGGGGFPRGALPGGSSRAGAGCPRGGSSRAGAWVPSWCPSEYSQPTTQAGTRDAPQRGGALACESKLQGKFAGCDCSNYQLFMCPSWGGFYRLVYRLKC